MSILKTLALWISFFAVAVLMGQSATAKQGLESSFQITEAINQVDVIAGNSRRIRFDYKVPELLVENPEIVKATPISPSEILITGVKPGLSTVTVSDPDKKLQTITVNVTADVRRLEAAIRTYFPDCSIKVHALQTGVIVAGMVTQTDQVGKVMAVAQDYFPSNVINQLQVDTAQLVAIKVKVYEVSRTKLRKLGVDWALLGQQVTLGSSIAGLIGNIGIGTQTVAGQGQTFTFGLVGDNSSFVALLDALEQYNVAKLLDQPTLVAQHGRPAEFLSGGEIPVQVASGLGTNSIEYRPFGTKLDIVPLVHGHGELTLEVRAEVSELASDLAGEDGSPGFRVRRVNTGVRMKAGHTLALAGDYREEVEDESRGLPHLMHSPLWGPMFRTVKEKVNETELVFMITPRFISEVDPTAAPKLGVGQLTQSPSNRELYINGYLEVPRCRDECPTNDRFDDPVTQQGPQIQRSIQQNIRHPAPLHSSRRDLNHSAYSQRPNGNRSAPYRPRSYQMVPTPAVTPPSRSAVPQPITGTSRLKPAPVEIVPPSPNQFPNDFNEPTNGPPNSN